MNLSTGDGILFGTIVYCIFKSLWMLKVTFGGGDDEGR